MFSSALVLHFNFSGHKVLTEANSVSEATFILENYQSQGTSISTNGIADC